MHEEEKLKLKNLTDSDITLLTDRLNNFVMTPISQAAIKGELLGCSNHNFSNTQGGL